MQALGAVNELEDSDRYGQRLRALHERVKRVSEKFDRESAIVRTLYHFYFHHLLPLIGGVISGHRTAYKYLPRSVANFPAEPALARRMSDAGFVDVRWTSLTFGIAAIHVGRRVPVYRKLGEFRTKRLREIMHAVLAELKDEAFTETLPAELQHLATSGALSTTALMSGTPSAVPSHGPPSSPRSTPNRQASVTDTEGTIRATDIKASIALVLHGLLFSGVLSVTKDLGGRPEFERLLSESNGRPPEVPPAPPLPEISAAEFLRRKRQGPT